MLVVNERDEEARIMALTEHEAMIELGLIEMVGQEAPRLIHEEAR